MIQTRGERNFNPGNIDKSDSTLWQGMAAVQSDPRFVVFSDAVFGIRALAKILLNYYHKHDLNPIKDAKFEILPPLRFEVIP